MQSFIPSCPIRSQQEPEADMNMAALFKEVAEGTGL